MMATCALQSCDAGLLPPGILQIRIHDHEIVVGMEWDRKTAQRCGKRQALDALCLRGSARGEFAKSDLRFVGVPTKRRNVAQSPITPRDVSRATLATAAHTRLAALQRPHSLEGAKGAIVVTCSQAKVHQVAV